MLRLALMSICLASAALCETIPGAGRVENAEGLGMCSAGLIAPDLILTAAHCVGTSMDGQTFRPGTGVSGPVFALKRTASHPFFDPEYSRPNWKVRFDIRIVELAEPVPDWVAQPFPLGKPAEVGETLFIVSWRRGEGSIPRQRACKVIPGLRGIVTLACPVNGGESGAPVLRRTEAGLELVAIISSRSAIGKQPVALASDVELRLPPLRDAID